MPRNPTDTQAKERHWREEISRTGRGDETGGVCLLPGYDHNGKRVSPQEEETLRQAGRADEPPDESNED